MAISKDQEEKLRAIQDKAVDHAIEELNAADELGIESREDRGDRYFLTKMAKESLTVAAKVEGFIMLRTREGRFNLDPDEEKEAVDRMIKRARGEVDAILKRAKDGTPAK
jgi:hypothetical protein